MQNSSPLGQNSFFHFYKIVSSNSKGIIVSSTEKNVLKQSLPIGLIVLRVFETIG